MKPLNSLWLLSTNICRNLASSKRVTQHQDPFSSPLFYLTSWDLRSTVLFAADGWLIKRPATSKLALRQRVFRAAKDAIMIDTCYYTFVHPPGCTAPGMNPNVNYKLWMIIKYHRSSYMRECLLSSFSHIWLLATLWTVACQAPLSMGILQEYWSGLSYSPSGDLPKTVIKPMSRGFFAQWATWEISQ